MRLLKRVFCCRVLPSSVQRFCLTTWMSIAKACPPPTPFSRLAAQGALHAGLLQAASTQTPLVFLHAAADHVHACTGVAFAPDMCPSCVTP